MKTVIVGLSGGVDSSFTAAYLKEQGYQVIGIMLRLWAEAGQDELNRCCSPDAMMTARRVAAMLDIPFYAIDAKTAFREKVVEYFIQGYKDGVTPNPCLVCNTEIRWKLLIEQADKFGAEDIATGHYAQIDRTDNTPRLLKGIDRKKDQSYVLSRLPLSYLSRTILPAGRFIKDEVREYCRRLNLPSASRPDSQDLCFLGDMDYREFLKKYAPDSLKPGEIVDKEGNLLGYHQGLASYTPGQRKGLRIAYKEPLYVIQKDVEQNRVIVGNQKETGLTTIRVKDFNWLISFEKSKFSADVQVRYNSKPHPALIKRFDEEVIIEFKEPVMDVAKGQVAALFHEDVCLGGGIIV